MDAASLLPTLQNSSLWLQADMKSLTGYAIRTLPTSIADATTPVNGEKARPLITQALGQSIWKNNHFTGSTWHQTCLLACTCIGQGFGVWTQECATCIVLRSQAFRIFAGNACRWQGRQQQGSGHVSTSAAAQVDYKDRVQIMKARDAADVPGAARYLLRSAPEMMAAAAQVKWQDFLNVVELQTLVRPAQTVQVL